jgi:hypothetical protein
MKIICDVDGVILDFAKGFSDWWNQNNDIKIDSKPDTWCFGLSEGFFSKGVAQFCKTPALKSLDYLFKDTEEYFNILSSMYQVNIVTALPEKYSKSRIANLSKLKYNSIKFIEHKLDYLIKSKPDVCIEDRPDYIKKLSENKISVFYPNNNYCKGLSKFGVKFNSWKDLLTKLQGWQSTK